MESSDNPSFDLSRRYQEMRAALAAFNSLKEGDDTEESAEYQTLQAALIAWTSGKPRDEATAVGSKLKK